jgi:hypothetical protein
LRRVFKERCTCVCTADMIGVQVHLWNVFKSQAISASVIVEVLVQILLKCKAARNQNRVCRRYV